MTALLGLCAATPVRAEQFGSGAGAPQPILLRLTGFVGAAPAGVDTLGSVTLGMGQTVTTMQLTAVQVLNGPLTEGRAALRQFDQYSPNLLLVGDPALLQAIRNAAPDGKIAVFGYLHAGARRLIVTAVEPA